MMFRLLATFVLVQLAILARYVVYDAFDSLFYASTYLLLIAAVAIYFVSKCFVKKEIGYTPNETESWSFLNKQRMFTIEKPLYKGNVRRGSIQRIFVEKWHYIITDLLGSTFFLAFTLKLDEHTFDVIPASGKLFSNQSYWTIHKNGQPIGTAKTVVDLKNTAKLKEVILLQIGDIVYSTAASTVTSHITLHNEQQIGEMKRSHLISSVNLLQVQDDTAEQMIALLLHAFHFKNA
ncbi:MAG: hypothetical protein ABS949_10585 [Solibacillus sp.]